MKVLYSFGTDGIREKYPFLNDLIAYILGKSFAKIVDNKNKIVIGYDTRFNSYSIALSLATSLISEGFKVEISSTYVSTPTLAFITKHKKCYGFQITASHNPFYYNGIKILYKGLKIEDNLEKKIENLLNTNLKKIHDDFSNYLEFFKTQLNSYKNLKFSNFITVYSNKIINYIKSYVDTLKGWEIIIDLSNGALSNYAGNIYKTLGAKVNIINNKPDGFNINHECGATNINLFKEKFLILSNNHKKSIGLSFDGDGDRVISIYKSNKETIILDGDIILLIISKFLKNVLKYNIQSVAITQMSPLGIEKAFQKENIKVIRTEVGDKYITKAILDGKADLGAEQSGHIVIPPFLYTGDGILSSMFLIASINFIDPFKVVQEIEKYEQKLINIPVTNKKEFINKNQKLFDKISKNYKDVRLYVRPSGTEDIVRILIESKEIQLIKEIENIINKEVVINV
ncbi:MAG: hypothetical protein N2169_02315 [bacterium]|nr:hypothetical protein [bacterium]